ncbi:MAG: hypothetical protein V3S46_08805 [Nitrospinota bacterium]
MNRLLAGVFLGVFAGAFTYEILKRVRPDWAGILHDGLERTVDGIEGVITPFTGRDNGKSRAKSIPVE